jgi:hypothetical protein
MLLASEAQREADRCIGSLGIVWFNELEAIHPEPVAVRP